MFRILIAVLVFNLLTAAQIHNKNLTHLNKKVQAEVFTLLADSIYRCYFKFKVPYSSLVFEKDNLKFNSKFEIVLEIKNSKDQIVQRKFKKDTIELYDYEQTISENEFIFNFIEFELYPDTIQCIVTFNDLITGKPFDVFHQKLDLVSTKYTPRWLLLKQSKTIEPLSYEIDIFGNVIPHSSNNYDLLIVRNFDLTKVEEIKIKSEDSAYVNLDFDKYNSTSLKLSLQNKRLFIKLEYDSTNFNNGNFQSDQKLNLIIIKNINEKLFEGKYSLVLYGLNSQSINEIPITVSWIDKPNSLFDYDFALEMIEFIEVNKNYRTYFSSDTEKKNKIFNYWKLKDPTLSTSFNELMNEFYLRVDYAQKEFISISQKNGAKTDRGKVFILNGKPNRIIRNVNSDGKVVESWYYENPERVFTFIDIRGDGNFKSL